MEGLNKKKRKFTMPTALTIVMIFLAIVGIMTWFIPTSVITYDDAGNSIIHFNAAFDADGNVIENAGTDPVGLWDFFLAPIEGLIEAADIAATIFISGGFLAIMNKAGALDAGIGSLIKRFSGKTLIALLTFVFAVMGTVYGAWEELPAYAIVIIPLFVSAGYDVMTGVMVILAGSIIGNMASVVNPYSIGTSVAAIGNPELTLGSGITLRLVLFVVMLALGIFLITRYATKVKKHPELSCVAHIDDSTRKVGSKDKAMDVGEIELTGRRKASLAVFIIMIIICVIGYIPWDQISIGGKTAFDIVNIVQTKLDGTAFGDFLGTGKFLPFGWWYFNEFSTVWLIGAIIVGLINKMSESDFVNTFVQGASELTGVVLVLAASRGISIFMGTREAGMSITFIYWIRGLLEGVPLWAFVIAAVAVYLMIGIFLQSSSGVAGITMPIFGTLAYALFAGSAAGAIGGQILLMSSFACSINFVCGLYPESTNMGICEMANVPYNIFVKQQFKILAPVLLIGTIIISIAPYIGLV